MSKTVTNLLEVSQPTDFKVDREARVIRDVRILGPKSRNGREYTSRAITQARGLYEGIVVNYDHPANHANPAGPRSVTDVAGWAENVNVAPDGGLVADVHFLKSDPRAEKLCEAAERRPQLFGMSHNIEAKTRRTNGKTLVEEITRVRSVDVVSDPATTRSLFESIEQEEADMSVTITEYLEKQEAENPSVKLLQEMVDVGIVKSDFAVDEETSGKLTNLLEVKMQEGVWARYAEALKAKKKIDEPPANDPPVDDKLAKILESQESLQKQLTEMKGRLDVVKPQSGMPINEGANGDQGEKSKDAKDFFQRVTV